MRVGIGYDVHRLSEGRSLMLGGVRFEHPLGLAGHSDADVLLHAIMDAVLGAAALGDIGHHFPPGDPAYKDCSSLELLGRVRSLVEAQGWRIANVDSTVIAEEPKLALRVAEMRAAIGNACGLPVERVSVKATTNEGLGFVGRDEGIAALAVALLDSVNAGQR
ncbi:MAG: 2-C-methyl-D-erythritol 2,4-cyclodiphosphate synthase [Chloroflexi bacterium]|nr:2-C-methyl-D-erythritol 2,4-cyclodiphosphate synthase [Chloroflexota bacterium]